MEGNAALHLESIVALSSCRKTSISWISFEQLFSSSVSEANFRIQHFLYPIVLNEGLSYMFMLHMLLSDGLPPDGVVDQHFFILFLFLTDI